jgi:hypothetical protein
MSRVSRLSLPVIALAGLLAACSDTQPSEPAFDARNPNVGAILTSCAVAQDSVDAMLPQLFTPGSQRGVSASDNAKMNKALRSTDVTTARKYMQELIDLATTSYYAVPSQIIGAPSDASRARVQDLITGLLCLNGITTSTGGPIPVTLPADNSQGGAGLVTPTAGGLVRNGAKTAGTIFNPGDVSGNVWVTIAPNPAAHPLDTPLDQFGPFFEFNVAPLVSFNNPVLTGVCTNLVPLTADQEARIRLAHNLDPSKPTAPGNLRFGNIEILARQSIAPLGLICTSVLSSASFLDKLKSFLLPEALYAGTGTGGSGGKVTNYSPFGSVDPGELTYGTANWLFYTPSTGNATAPTDYTGIDGVTAPIGGSTWKFGLAPFGDVRASPTDPATSYASFCNAANGTIDYGTVIINAASIWQRATSSATSDLTYLFARRVFFAPTAGAIDLPIDNDVQVWLDGVDVTSTLQYSEGTFEGGFLIHDGCATLNQVTLPSVSAGVHVLAVKARDRGTASYFDAKFYVPVQIN